MNVQPLAPPDPRPAGNQFSLRGLLILITALSVIFALLALAIRQPLHWLGMVFVVGFCLVVIAIMEGVRRTFPPKPRLTYYHSYPPLPANPLQTLDLSEGESPFGTPPKSGENPFAPAQVGRMHKR